VDGAPEVVAIHAADLAGRKMGLIEQRFGLGDKRRIFVVRAPWRSTVDRRRGDRGYGRRLPTALAADAGRLTARMAANTRKTRANNWFRLDRLPDVEMGAAGFNERSNGVDSERPSGRRLP
jgi:hypothetical protein